ncbi:hypothetical protein GCM10007939_19130 [Amylibacter marinus]|uniref:Tetrapyrrole biosynthesis uroporphyrinogen III synthase domain-containing protein n=1 Tax=Amylibacter marinus TaxID=1475483 RepID=A0ABQ5VW30_9RHOB|nr:uroporphyrinogen-III synthase [Amylibacter marinus]GLQ35630.1 hypothetical protein GCM10007939_19130 [Amylibacter marinus]
MTQTPATILMTRPARQAQDFIRAFEQVTDLSPPVIYAPALDIEPIEFNPSGLWPAIFTSMHALDAYCTIALARGDVVVVGEILAEAARGQGFTVIGTFATAHELAQNLPDRAQYYRGEQVSVDLGAAAIGLGTTLFETQVYRQGFRPLTHRALESLRAGAIVPIFSHNSALNICAQIPHGIEPTFVVISDHAAKPLVEWGFSHIVVAHAPTRGAMISALRTYF